MYLYKTPYLVKKLFPDFIWNHSRQDKVIYLTFDDGPIPDITEWVLDELDKYNAKATFFCVGDNIEKHQGVFLKILIHGHSVGNHTYHHLKGWNVLTEDYMRDIELCQQAIMKIQPFDPQASHPFFRPPYGRITLNQSKALAHHYQVVMWDVLTHDYDERLDENTSLKKAVKYSTNGSIVVFHDSIKARKNLYYVLPRYLQHFSKLGYRFEAL